jgi:hypothetical protein
VRFVRGRHFVPHRANRRRCALDDLAIREPTVIGVLVVFEPDAYMATMLTVSGASGRLSPPRVAENQLQRTPFNSRDKFRYFWRSVAGQRELPWRRNRT